MTMQDKAAPRSARPFQFKLPPYVIIAPSPTPRPFPFKPFKANVAPTLAPKPAPIPYPAIPAGGPWKVDPIWPGPIFVIAGGPSVSTVNMELIRGRRVIAVNSSYEAAPWADIIYFGDGRWWDAHRKKLMELPGRLVTVSNLAKHPRLLKLKRVKPTGPHNGFTESPEAVSSQRTSLQGAMNLAAHLGGNPIVLLGADMGRAADGRSHHHTPHKWTNRPGNATWDEQMRHLRWIVEPLAKKGIKVINCSLVSRIKWWPKMTLEEYLATEKV